MSKDSKIVGKIRATELITEWSGGVIGRHAAGKLLVEALENGEIPYKITGSLKHHWYMSVVALRRWYDDTFPAEEEK